MGMLPELKEASGLVTVSIAPPRFFQITVVPMATVIELGRKEPFLISMVFAGFFDWNMHPDRNMRENNKKAIMTGPPHFILVTRQPQKIDNSSSTFL
jgi:hypothetical protein